MADGSPLLDTQRPGQAARQASQLLRRSASSLLGIDPPAENASVPPNANREVLRQHAQQSLDQVLLNTLPLLVVSVIAGVMMLLVGMYGLYAFFKVIWASAKYGDLPCDEPLANYWKITLAVAFVQVFIRRSKIFRLCFEDVDNMSNQVNNLMATIVQVTCLQWITDSKTCAETNPELYYAVKHLVYWQLCYLLIALVLLVVVGVALRRLVSSGVLGAEGRGCAETIERLEAIPLDSEELLDPEDQQPKECVICFRNMSARVGEESVKTLCGHYFHRACLKTWCEKHVTCPVCRTNLEEEDQNV